MIELAGVRVDHPRGGAPLLDGADLAIERGEVVLLGAPAGAGSSRLLATILGDHLVAEGKVALFGRDVARLRRSSLLRLRRKVGVIPEDLRLLPEASALVNVLLPLDIDHVPRKEAAVRAAEALGQVGLAAEVDVRVAELSLAERQRVAVARALVRSPSIVIADQPTSHQDAEHAAMIAHALTQAAATGATVLVASRDPVLWGLAPSSGWRTVVIAGAHVVAAGIAVEPEPYEVVVEADVVESAPNVVPFPKVASS